MLAFDASDASDNIGFVIHSVFLSEVTKRLRAERSLRLVRSQAGPPQGSFVFAGVGATLVL